jgi:hypothetical protein
MTGGGDLDEIEDEDADVMDDDELGGLDQIADTEIDEAGTGGGGPDVPVPDAFALNENDPDPTAGASDVGGVPGGVEPETGQ